MATKFYLPSSGAAGLLPAWSASWYAGSASPEKLAATTTKPNSGLVTEALTDADLTDRHYYFGMWVSAPLAAQTIAAQTISGSIRCSEDNAKNNLSLHWIIRLLKSDNTYRGDIVSFADDVTEAYTSLRSLTFSATSTQIVASLNDRIVIELGMGGDPASGGGSHNSTMSIGETSAGADLDASDADTGADNPWVNFANTLTFAPVSYPLYAGTGAFTLAGQNALLRDNRRTLAGTGAFALAGQNAKLYRNLPLWAGTGAFALAGQTSIAHWNHTLLTTTGAFALAGGNAILSRHIALLSSTGAFILAGQDAKLARGLILWAGTGAFALAGQNSIAHWNHTLLTTAGAFALAGGDAILSRHIALLSSAGAFNLAGQDAILARGLLLWAETGGFVLAGMNAIMTYTVAGEYALFAGTGAFALAGLDAKLLAHHILKTSAGSFAVTGNNALLLLACVLLSGKGAFILTGNNAILTYSGGGGLSPAILAAVLEED